MPGSTITSRSSGRLERTQTTGATSGIGRNGFHAEEGRCERVDSGSHLIFAAHKGETLKSYPLHPVCNIFPPLDERELNELAEDIKANGLLDPVILYDDKILDGRNRQEACRRAGVPLRTIEWVDPGCGPTAWVVARNLKRRHLTTQERAYAANKALPFYQAEARARQQAAGGGAGRAGGDVRAAQSMNGSPVSGGSVPIPDFGERNIVHPVSGGEAAERAAADFGVGKTYVEEARRLERERPEAYAAVERREITHAQAMRELRGDQHKADAEAGRPPEDSPVTLLFNMQSAAIGLFQRIEQLGIDGFREYLKQDFHPEIREQLVDTLEGWDTVEIVAEQVRSAI